MEEKSINVYNLLIIDESGSMHSIYDQKQYVSIVTFEGNGMGGVRPRS